MKSVFTYSREMTTVALLNSYIWIATSLVYYGIGLNMGNLPGNAYVNILIGAGSEVVGILFYPLCVKHFGRRGSCMLNFAICGVCIAASSITAEYRGCDEGSIVDISTIVLALSARAALAMQWCIIYLMSTELFPTPVRGNGVSIAS